MKSKRSRAALLVGVLLVTGLGCARGDRNERAEKGGPEPSSVSQVDSAVDVSAFLAAIRGLSGEFTTIEGYGWTLAGGQELFAQAGSFDDSVVDSLVACLGDATPSNVTLRGERVPVAILCYEALKRTAIVPFAEDADEPWSGALRPNSSSAQIREAHRAWTAVVAAGQYRRM